MANRTVAVHLKAEVGSFVQGMKNAAAATKDLTSSTLDTARKNKQSLQDAGLAMAGFGAAVGAGVGFAVSKFADFDKAMSAVRAATHETAGNMDALRDAAMEAGARTAFSATEAAEGIEALAKAGVSTKAILNGGLNGALDLAAAGALGVGEAAEIAATALTQFQLDGSQVPHVADLLAAAAGKAQGEVSDMGQALKQSGLVAAQTGLTIEETTAGLAAFASAGLLGSDAGTSLKTALQRLTPQSEEAAGLMQELGINAYDAAGNFVGLEAFAGNLQTSLSGLTDEQRNSAMATIFGSDAVRAASVLYEQGASGIAEWTAKVNDAGYAQETAAARLDNLSGDIEAFMGSVETALIKTGSAGDDFARGAVQSATSAVNAYGSLPQSMQGAVLAVGGVTAALAGVSGAFLLALPRIASTRDAMKDLRTEMPRTAGAMDRITNAAAKFAAFTVATQILHGLIAATSDSADGVEAATKRILGSLADVDKGFRDLDTWSEEVGGLEEALHLLADPGLANRLGDLGGEILTFGGNEGSFRRTAIIEQLNSMGEALAKLVSEGRADLAAEKFAEFAAAADRAGMDVDDLRKLMPAYGEALAGVENKATLAGTAQQGLTADLDATAEAAEAAAEKIQAIADIDASFVSPMDAYQAVFDRLEASDKASAEASAETHNDAIDKKIKARQREYDARIDAARRSKDLQADELRADAATADSARTSSGRKVAATAATKNARREALTALKHDTDGTIQAIEDERDATVAALGDQKTSWEDYAKGVHVSVDDYLAELKRQVEAQSAWETNMLILAGRVSSGTLQELYDMGPEAATLIADLANGTDAQLATLDERMAARGTEATTAFGDALINAGPVLEEIARTQGRKVSDAIAKQIADRKITVEQAMAKYGIAIENGVAGPIKRSVDSTALLIRKLTDLDGMRATVTIEQQIVNDAQRDGVGAGITERASGGSFSAGPLLVGERGPELLFPDAGGYVLNNRATLEALNASNRFATGGWVSGRSGGSSGSVSAADNRQFQLHLNAPIPRQSMTEVVHALRDQAFQWGFA